MDVYIVTPWTPDRDGYDPLFHQVLIAGGHAWKGALDITDQLSANIPPRHNLCVWYIAEISQEGIDALGADNRCRVIANSQMDSVPTTVQFNFLRNWLGNKGLTAAEIDAAVGTSVSGRTFRVIITLLMDWLRTLTRA